MTILMRDVADRANVTHELRDLATVVELRAGDGDALTFEGVASVVDTPYAVRDMFGEFTETIVKGAFTKTLKEKADVRFLVNHDGVPLARTKSKTLRLSATPDLLAIAELDAANPRVQEIRSAMDRGDMDQMSIGMRVHRQEWNEDYTERFIREAELFDVSVVTFPASPTTSAKLRSLDELMASLTDLEMTDDEIRRAIAHFESRLPPPASLVGEMGPEMWTDDFFAERDREDRERLERKRLIRPALI